MEGRCSQRPQIHDGIRLRRWARVRLATTHGGLGERPRACAGAFEEETAEGFPQRCPKRWPSPVGCARAPSLYDKTPESCFLSKISAKTDPFGFDIDIEKPLSQCHPPSIPPLYYNFREFCFFA